MIEVCVSLDGNNSQRWHFSVNEMQVESIGPCSGVHQASIIAVDTSLIELARICTEFMGLTFEESLRMMFPREHSPTTDS